VSARPWRGYDDLRPMQALALEVRRLVGPRSPWHVGDIAWGLRQHAGREHEWRIRLWEDEGRVVAWSWLQTDRNRLELDVHPGHLHLLDELLDEPGARVAFVTAGVAWYASAAGVVNGMSPKPVLPVGRPLWGGMALSSRRTTPMPRERAA
jgi:hypothetical protein